MNNVNKNIVKTQPFSFVSVGIFRIKEKHIEPCAQSMNRTIYSYDKLLISVVRHTTIIYVYCRVKYDHIGIIMCNTNISIYINTEFDIKLINAVKTEYIKDRV